MKQYQDKTTPINMEQFTKKIAKEDHRNQQITRNFQWLMWIIAPLYCGMFLVNPDPDLSWNERLGGLLYVIAFVLFALIFRKLNKEYRSVDYGIPVVEMLRQAVNRYKLFQKKVLWAIVPIIFTDAGMIFLTLEHTGSQNLLTHILTTQAIIIPAFAIGLTIGIFIWRQRQKPLRDAALRMLREIESEPGMNDQLNIV